MWQYLATAGAPIVGKAVGYFAGKGDRDRQRRAMEQAYGMYDGMGLPEKFQELDGSATAGVNPDELGVQAQRAALRRLQEIGLGGGLTAEDKGQLEDIRQQQIQVDAGQRGAIEQNARAHGLGNSNMSISSALQAQQFGENRAARQGMDVASMAQKRALQALQSQGSLAGQLRGQSFDEGMSKASAADKIATWNKEMAAGSANARWKAQMAIADAKQRALMGQAGMYGDSADRKSDFWGGLGGGVSKGIGGYANNQAQQQKDQRSDNSDAQYAEYLKYLAASQGGG